MLLLQNGYSEQVYVRKRKLLFPLQLNTFHPNFCHLHFQNSWGYYQRVQLFATFTLNSTMSALITSSPSNPSVDQARQVDRLAVYICPFMSCMEQSNKHPACLMWEDNNDAILTSSIRSFSQGRNCR